jgi:pimeloyl-ACP methyl ester carboxylesterase
MLAEKQKDVTAVLVHAAWFDGSSWSKVASDLQRKGLRVAAAQLPLTSLSDDVAAVRRILAKYEGPVVLVGHSYGGAVITAAGAGNPNVKALVYVAAIVPDEGESVGQVFQRLPPHPSAPELQPDADGFLWVKADDFRNAIAPDATPEEADFMAAAQKPISVNCLGEIMGKAAWRGKPSWFLIAEKDRMVSPDTQRFLAERMKSKVVSLPADHAPLTSWPSAVAKLIEAAVAYA